MKSGTLNGLLSTSKFAAGKSVRQRADPKVSGQRRRRSYGALTIVWSRSAP